MPLEVLKACDLPREAQRVRWLIEELWLERAVGILGGEPKCCKSILALEIAVAVASGRPCLRRFAVPRAGPVLIYPAEDGADIVRRRLEGIAHAAAVSFESLDVHVITTPTLRLDHKADRTKLTETVETMRPRLLILDPFVRLHGGDENVASEVAPLLGYLRQLERGMQTAVLLVHHARKRSHTRAGQALRGSSEFHAWGDSNLYLRRNGDRLQLTVEHRAAAAMDDAFLELHSDDDRLALDLSDHPPDLSPCHKPSPTERVLNTLSQSSLPLSLRDLRDACKMRTADLCRIVADLKGHGAIIKSNRGYQLASNKN